MDPGIKGSEIGGRTRPKKLKQNVELWGYNYKHADLATLYRHMPKTA